MTNATGPVLSGHIHPGDRVAGMRVVGDRLHVSMYEKQSDLAKCLAGVYCARGGLVKVYDISEPSTPVELGNYDGNESPAVDMIPFKGGSVLVRQEAGFKVYEAVSAAE